MDKDVLLEMMASVLQSIYDEGYASEFRHVMQEVLVAYNNSGLTPRAADLPKLCANCQANHGDSTCEEYQLMLAASG